jgi:hypothetical protein
MPKLRHSRKLFMEFVGFARSNKFYWMIPLAIFLGLAAFVIVAGGAAAPLIYTLF